MTKLYRLWMVVGWLMGSVSCLAQSITVSGRVTDGQQPLPGAILTLDPTGDIRYTDEQGTFRLILNARQPQTLTVSLLGRQPVVIRLKPARDTTLTIVLNERSFSLSEVSVVAKEQRIGSSSVLNKLALIHVQPTSLADVLQLVPGQLATNPNLGVAQQVTLRQIPTTADALRANALGTAIVQDGVPLSNNANLQTAQTILNASPGSLPVFSSVAGRGIDLRQIGADNIESVEVVRGIPSARYGDLTSGLIVVQSRIGNVRPELRIRLNPTLAQAAFVSGVALNRVNTLNVSVDVLRAQDDPRDRINTYTRSNGQLAWQWKNPTFTTTTILTGYRTLDDRKLDPNDTRTQRLTFASETGGKFSTQGYWRLRKPGLNSLRYVAALTYASQQAYTQELLTRDLFPLSTALADTTLRGRYGESEYLSRLTVDGRPLNAYANLEANWLIRSGNAMTQSIILGMEGRYDTNFGEGRVFDPTRPPRQNYGVGERPRAFSSIPALGQLSYYLEDKLSGQLGQLNYVVQAGLRIDNVQPSSLFASQLGIVASPRINVALEALPDLFVRAGVGQTAKAPTLDVLYPGPRFFDLVNVNYFAQNPAERLLLMTTRVIDPGNTGIAPFRSRKAEVGLDGNWRGFDGSVSLFRETTTGAFGQNRLVQPYTLARYGIAATPPGQPPVLTPQPTRYDTVFVGYDVPVANRQYENRGVEFSLLTPEWPRIRTAFQLNGAWIQSNAFDDGIYVDADRAYTSQTVPRRVAIYQSATNRTAIRFNTALRLIHRIPTLGFVISVLWQTIWTNTSRSEPLNPYAIGYVDRLGLTTYLTPEQGQSAEFTNLRRTIDTRQEVLFDPPPLHLFNLRVTKEWAKGYGFSFYANNVTGNRPLTQNPQSGAFIRRKEPLFFGAEINLSF